MVDSVTITLISSLNPSITMFSKVIIFVVAFVATASGFVMPTNVIRSSATIKMVSFDSILSMPLAELYSSPTATYKGELIDKSLKLVTQVPKPDGYVYGQVSDAGLPVLALGALVVVVLAAAVPYFLAIGETAQKQQREREASDKTVNNMFTIKGTKDTTGVKAGTPKSAGNAALRNRANPKGK